MKVQNSNFDRAATQVLTEDDLYVLETIYTARKKTFFFVFFAMLFFVGIRALPMLLWPKDSLQFSGAVTGIILVLILPFIILYRKRVSPYRKDILAGFKYETPLLIVGKQYFEHTGQCFLCLDNPDYMHHEVDWDTYHNAENGEYYPVYFAPHSGYAFNLRATITWM